jgi:hypothetical protein
LIGLKEKLSKKLKAKENPENLTWLKKFYNAPNLENYSLTEHSRKSFEAFKTEWEEGQAFKKRAVIQLINATMGGQKKMYGRWLGITERTRLMN